MTKKKHKASLLSLLNNATLAYVCFKEEKPFGPPNLLMNIAPCEPSGEHEPAFMLSLPTDDDAWLTLSREDIKAARKNRKGHWDATVTSMCGTHDIKLRFYHLKELQ